MTDHKAKPLTRREVLNQCASIRADGHEPLTLAVEPEILLATLDAQDELLRERDEARRLFDELRTGMAERMRQRFVPRGERDELLARLAVGVDVAQRCIQHATAGKPEATAPPRNRLQNIVCLLDGWLATTPEALTTWRDERDAAAFARGVEAAIAKVEASTKTPGEGTAWINLSPLLDALRSLIPSTNKESGR